MPGKERSPMSGGVTTGGCSSEAKRKSSVEACEGAKEDDDDDLLTLSLGLIRSNDPAAAPGPRRAAAALPDDCLPVTPTLPAPLRPVNVAIAPPPTSFALGLAASVVHVGNGDAFLATAGALTAASKLPPPTTWPLLPPHFPSGGGGGNSAFAVTPVHGSGITPSRPPLTGFVPPAKSPPAKSASPPPKKRRRVTNRSNKADNGNAAPISNGGLTENQPPFPWAKQNRVAEHYSLAELSARGIHTIDGEVQCKRCDARTTLSLDIKAKFNDLREFIARNVQAMDDRAPEEWKDPALPDCDRCGQRNSLRPVIAAEKERINWVFLLLGQTLGLCTLEQLKHFCAHTNQHRTGAKDRVLYSTYMELCNQLCPGGPFDMAFERRNRARPAFV